MADAWPMAQMLLSVLSATPQWASDKGRKGDCSARHEHRAARLPCPGWMVWLLHAVKGKPGHPARSQACMPSPWAPSWPAEAVLPLLAEMLRHGQVKASCQVQLYRQGKSRETSATPYEHFCTVQQGLCAVTRAALVW